MREGKALVVLRGDRFLVRGVLAPAVAGQAVELGIFRKGRRIGVRRLVTGPDGSFAVRVRAKRAGRLSVRATHAASPQIAAANAKAVIVYSERPQLGPGRSGRLVRMVQRGLAKLRFSVSRSGVYDAATGRAVMAYRKTNGFTRLYTADKSVVRGILAGKGAFKPRHPRAGRHVEADLSRQVLALIEGGKVVSTYHTSSGAGATPTVIGTFRVYLKTPGTNARGMVHSSYFIRGYAIHGYVDVPAFGASHGCLRIPIPNARRVYDWLRIGDRVIVYP
jgi:lipoprotein-anchoring transpeptidase ErfK/SrfK